MLAFKNQIHSRAWDKPVNYFRTSNRGLILYNTVIISQYVIISYFFNHLSDREMTCQI